MLFTESVEIKPIPGCEGYGATADGRIITYRRPGYWGKPSLVSQQTTMSGHRKVTIRVDNTPVTRTVHQFVIAAWRGPSPGPGYVIRHLNGDPADNRIENLSWGTRRENALDAVRHGTHPSGERHPIAKLTEDQVRDAKRRMAYGESGNALAKELGVSRQAMYNIRNGKTWAHVEVDLPPRTRRPVA